MNTAPVVVEATEARTEARTEALADVVHREGELLDDRRYDEWAELFTDDCRYWAPYDWYAPEPRGAMNIIYDDKARLLDRVSRLTGGDFHSQDPASHTTRLIGVVRPLADPGSWTPPGVSEAAFTASFRLTELRREVLTEYSGRVSWWLRTESGSPRIVAKKVQLLGANRPLANLTFPL
ncbi:aromatic-ring-hydroxylating dioxygenase subunit beta [Nocardioides acrostichi]|uniref:Nuclear transport factor 2 family protein n=1 Tax=Nocardioides acrostichi TaxID=2784339 RepID=A0A930UYA1_9ACTN|nr:aromatic-ring-hydroxylating dioxygenase subunit beta [Nocardioides acrostichi]MBF4163108.1 nuclear transport factor 2 family protein [Nocardioides acrostichi]